MGDMFGATTQIHGVLATPGGASKVIDRWVGEFADEAGRQGVDVVGDYLSTDLRNPTGHYQSQIAAVRSEMGVMVTDGGVVYGDWLEGSSTRNQKSRFKGYWAFRRAAAELVRRLPIIDSKTRPRFLKEMNS